MKKTSLTNNSQALKNTILGLLEDRKALDIISLDLEGKSSIADYLIIASGTSQRHIGSIAEGLRQDLQPDGSSLKIEGMPQADWVLVDAGNVIVHLFRPEVRDFYALEKLWG